MPRSRGGEGRELPESGSIIARRLPLVIAVAVVVLMTAIGAGVAFGADTEAGEEAALVAEPAAGTPEPTATVPDTRQIEEAREEESVEELEQGPETDPRAAEELPHRALDGEEALELAEGVFDVQLEEPAGIFDELEPEEFISDFAAVVPAATLIEAPGEAEASEPEAAEAPGPVPPEQPLFIESTLPLRTRNSQGEEEAVDLTLQSPEGSDGELQPQNPLAELTIPAHLGEGISVGEVGIALGGAPQESQPTNVEGQYAFYPNVAENTDLVVTPTPTGAEALSQIRSAEAPTTTTYELSLPDGAELKASEVGGAEVVAGGRTTMTIPPPTAIDAAGEPVPVELTVAGETLRLVASPGPKVAYPILVDPEFIQEAWYWSSNHDSLAAWTGTTNQWSYCPVPYALWAGPGTPGLGLTGGCDSNPVSSGVHAQWTYLVPRYQADITKYGSAPTSFVYQLYTQGVIFLPYGDARNYPVLAWGVWNPGTGGIDGEHFHYGSEGELNNWSTPYASTNLTANPADKGAEVMLGASAPESTAPRRDTYIGEAIVSVADMSPPVLKKLEAPKWVDTTAEPIAYEVEDTGLGVKAAWASYEGNQEKYWGFQLPCTGTVAIPCPRVAKSGESPALAYDPKTLPTGKDQVAFAFGDVLFGTGETVNHTTAALVTLKVDHTAPEVTLSGALTEQEKLGTLKSEYPLTIKAADGTVADPQSGVAKVEVKVDGKKVTMSNESAWNPGCATENCSFTGTWTLKTSAYTAAAHEVEVLVTDGAGVVSESTIEIDLGEAPPQTSFTSPHPSLETTKLEAISFKATRGGAPVEGATFKCSLDGGAATACPSPYTLPEHFKTGSHTFTVAAVDKAGKVDPTPARWTFETSPYPTAPQPSEKLVFPETGQQTASYYTLEAEWGANPEGKAGEGVTGVTFQMQLPGWEMNEKGEFVQGPHGLVPNGFEPVPAECVIDGQGRQVSWPLPVRTHPGHNAPVYLRVRGCPAFERAGYPESGIQFRAAFDGSKAVAGASAPATTEFVSRANANRVPTDATAPVGPATVDLVTGTFTTSRTDVSIPVPGYEANLEFTRTYSSTIGSGLKGYSRVLGGAWQPGSPLESESEGEAWSRIVKQVIPEQKAVYNDECWNEGEETVACAAARCNGTVRCEEWEEEPFQPREEWIELLDTQGAAVIFEITPEGNYVAPEYAKELKLTNQEGNFVLAYPNGSRNIFVSSGTNEWLPKYVSFQANASSMVMVYEPLPYNQLRLVREIAPAPEPIKCQFFGKESHENSEYHAGCRTLVFEYQTFSEIGHPNPASNEKLIGISYFGPSGSGAGTKVAEYTYHLQYTAGNSEPYVFVWGGYEKEEMLVAEKDPRLPIPAETYSYKEEVYGNLLSTCTPPGQEPWAFEYEYGNSVMPSRLKAVTRAGAKTTIAYGVPTHGSAAPYALGSEDIAKWGQTDLPVEGTAIFPPNHVPAEYPPHAYTGATIHYMDPEGHQVNTASPLPPGVSGTSIATTETDVKGNVVRELSPRNRLIALESTESAAVSHQLDSHSIYNANGTELLESWGPLHQVRLESTGKSEPARLHTVTRYDEGAPAPEAGTPPAYLPTKETVAAVFPGKEGEFEPRVTETKYEWKHRLPEETVVDPEGLDIRTITKYNAAGQVIETRQPKGAAGGTAGDTQTVYYAPAGGPLGCNNPRYANLPCLVTPSAQASGTGRKQLPVRWFAEYDDLGEPTQVSEYPANEPTEKRWMVTEYDKAGRPIWARIEGGGTPLAGTKARTETIYSGETGAPIEQKFVCEATNCTGFKSQATTTSYNKLGQVTRYVDAYGEKTETTYDAYGRPATVTDPKGTETLHYDENSGLVTSMEVSKVGTFTAAYDADGDLIRRGLPNGLTANTTYNQAGEPMELSYTKTSPCGEGGCTWYQESLERSIEGRILYGTSTLVKNGYRYDKAGRLEEAQETPTEGATKGICTARAYTFDADSNRKTKTTRSTGIAGPCGGTPQSQSYSYDEADRLEGPTYDAWGRITNLPEAFAGGKELKTTYFANDMVAAQEQNGVTNTFQLDATGRQRQREQAGGVGGIEIFHYDGPGDSPSWTALGAIWSRNISGIGGELAAVQEGNGTATTTTFKLTDLHGDAVASASSNPAETKLLATARFSEFGEPVSGGPGRFGWLGGKSRRTELQSGVVQMGARSYIPSLGRFLTPDPIRGGSANAYDYANQDPINNLDLNGEKVCINVGHANEACGNQAKELKRAAHRANKTGRIKIVFKSRSDARHFEEYLSQHSASRWVRTINLKAGEIHASELYKIEKKAQEIAVHEVAVSGGPSFCGDISAATGSFGVGMAIPGLAGAPETAGATAIPGAVSGAVSWLTGVLAGAGAC